MKIPQLSTRSIRVLRRDLLARQFAVPKLQRNFVWDAGRAAKLLDSIYHNMPIGSLFLWEIDRRSANLIRQSADVLPSFDTHNPRIWFVIDGQQRLSVIYQAFEAQNRKNDAGRDIDFGKLCFVLTADQEQESPRRIVYRKPQGRDYVAISDILAADWKPRMPSKAQWFLTRVKDCRNRLLRYPVPVVTVGKATLDEIGEVFIRVNSQGMRITSTDRAIALMGELDVRAMAQELRQRVRDEVFFLGAVDPILMGFNLISERPGLNADPPKLEAMARRWSKRIERADKEKQAFRKLWHRYQNAFLSAVDYLHRRFPVHDESYLPSANMLATLAVFFYYHPGQPSHSQSTEMRKWFWATGVARRYSGRGYHRNIVADARFFEGLAKGQKRGFVFRDYVDPVVDLQSETYSSQSARTRAFFCLLAARHPLYLENGEEIPLDGPVLSHSNRRNRHHLFPQAQMRNHVTSKIYNGLWNICFLVSRDNQKIGMRRPISYLGDYRDAGRAQFHRVMKSHLIPAGKDSGIWKRGLVSAYKTFRQQRLQKICSEFEKQAGVRLFRRS